MADVKELEKLTKAQLIEHIQEISTADAAILLEKNKQQAAELETAKGVIDELKEALEAAETSQAAGTGSQFPTVKVGADTYNIVIPAFTFKGERYTAKDVQEDEDLASQLVKRKSGALVKK